MSKATCMDIAEAAGLTGRIQKGGEYYFNAPYRKDANGSLRINPGKDLWRDDPANMGGTPWGLMAVYVGADPGDKERVKKGFKDLGLLNGGKGSNGNRRVVATFDYRDIEGNLVFQVIRYDPKGFTQRRPDGHGGSIYNLKGVDVIPYHLDRWHKKEAVVICEGEAKADLLWSWGIPATTAPMGAGKWRESYNQYFTGKRVVILPDNDEVGRKHALDVARHLLPVAAAVKIVELPRLPEKGDTIDWAAAGGTKEDLFSLIKETEALTTESIPEGEATPKDDEPYPVVVRLSDVEPEEIEWYWQDRLAKGKQSLIIGDPGLGKSTIMIDAACRISTGSPWPDGSPAPKGNSILLSAEDGIADTIRRRVDTLGGDPSRIHVLTAIKQGDVERPFSLVADIPFLERAILGVGDVRLVVVDPISAYLGTKDSYKDSEIRGVLAPLAALAEKYGVAVVGVMHLTKSGQQKALYRAIGSVAFVAAARTVFAVGQDPDDPDKRILVGVKNNLARIPEALAFRILEDGLLTWEGSVDEADAESVLTGGTPEERTERKDATKFLEDILADGEVASKEVFRAAKENGITAITLKRAKSKLGVDNRHEGQPGKPQKWFWSLPEDLPEDSPKGINISPKGLTSTNMIPLGQPNETKPISSNTSPKGIISTEVSPLGGVSGESGTLREETTEDLPAVNSGSAEIRAAGERGGWEDQL